MKELNELVGLANELNGEKWRYSRTSNFSNGYITGKDGRTIVETYNGDVPANACRFIEMADPHTILAIAEAFRALEQRVLVAEQGEKTFEEGFCSVRQDRDEWQQRAEVAEAKLAELEKQEPIGYHSTDARAVFRVWPYADGKICVPVYSRPAPAVSMAEMVPDEITPDDAVEILTERYGEFGQDHHFCCDSFEVGANWRRAQILRKIDEAK